MLRVFYLENPIITPTALESIWMSQIYPYAHYAIQITYVFTFTNVWTFVDQST